MMSTTSWLRVCRGCLATDARLYDMRQDRLMEAYNTLLSTAVQVSDDLPHYLCSYCAVLLLKCDTFRTKCIDTLIVLRNAKSQHLNLTSEHKKIMDGTTYLKQSELVHMSYVDDTPKQNDSDTYSDSDDSIDSDCSVSKNKINVNLKSKAKSIIKEHDYAITFSNDDITRLLKKHFDGERCLLKDFKVNIDCEASEDIKHIRYHQMHQLSEIINHTQYSSETSTELLKILDDDILKCKNKTSKSKSNPILKTENGETVAHVGKEHLKRDIVQNNTNKSIIEIHVDVKPVVVNSVDLNAEIPCLLRNDEIKIELSPDELFVFETHCDGINETLDSEEVIPIPDQKTNAKKIVQNKSRCKNINAKLKKRQLKLENITAEKFAKYNTEVRNLSKEEQIKEINDRKESDNYKNGQFKCNICFKGFLIEETYKNHMVLHDDSSGQFVCEICQCRFFTRKTWKGHHRSHGRVFTCKECGYTTKIGVAAVEHYKWHKGNTHSCDYCGKEFRKLSSKYGHIKWCHPTSEQLVRCEICEDSFNGLSGLQKHDKKAHKEMFSPECLCSGCDTQFYCSDAFKAHRGTDGLCDTLHKYCVRCGMSFETEELLKEHEIEQRKLLSQYKCDVCHKTFQQFSKLKLHQRCHLATFPDFIKNYYAKKMVKYGTKQRGREVICDVCGKSVLSPANLKQHYFLVHSTEKPFKCTVCHKGFKTSAVLMTHMRVHTGERPFQCQNCPKAFQSKPNLLRHNLVHTGERPHSCDVCGKTFQTKGSVKIHIQTVHMKIPMPPRIRNRKKTKQL